MKKAKLFFGSILALSAFVLIFVQCEKTEATPSTEAVTGNEPAPQYLPIAYVDSDSLLTHFDFYNNLVNNYENKLSKQSGSLNSGYQKFQSEVENYQQKVQNNAFLTADRRMQEETRLQRMQQDLEKKAAQMEQEMALEQRLVQQQLSDSLALGIKEFNTPQKYQMILTKTGNNMVLYADEHYNITEEVVKFLNERFKIEN